MVDNIDILTLILTIVLVVMMIVLAIIALMYYSSKKIKKAPKAEIHDAKEDLKGKKKVLPKEYSSDSIFNFMEFDKIEDNMIREFNGEKYLMVVECQGINYDLMSQAEKTSVEEGFIQFLNSLTHPVQIYTQTRTINLGQSIGTYKEQIKVIDEKYEKEKAKYNQMLESGRYTKQQLEKAYFELTKQANLCEYGKDVIYATEKMSLNKNVLNKNYYIIIPYYPSELGPNNFDKEEIKNLAFSELYTRAQSIIRTLGVCEISGSVLTSMELVDLLYVAYNRDDAEVYGIDKAIQAGFDELYSTAPDVVDKKMKMLEDEIQNRAIEKASNKIAEARSEKEKQYEERKETMDDIVGNLARLMIEQNASILGEEISQSAIQKIEEEKGGTEENVQNEKKTRKRRTTKTA